MITMRFGHGVSLEDIIAGGLRGGMAIAIACAIWWIVRRVPWPRPFRFSFVLMHVVACLALAFTWCVATNALITLAGLGSFDVWRYLNDYLFLGAFLYMFVAGPAYAAAATARAAQAEATVARAQAVATGTQLAALRAQLHFVVGTPCNIDILLRGLLLELRPAKPPSRPRGAYSEVA